MPTDSDRREQILATAASLLASSGIRTSLKEIGDACGILPGSLYHHFESKDALIIELVQRYRDELDQVSADALTAVSGADLGIEGRVTAFGEAIAACAVRNRAALLLTLYDPPKTASDELVRLAHQSPVAAISAMTEILEVGQKSGEIRSSRLMFTQRSASTFSTIDDDDSSTASHAPEKVSEYRSMMATSSSSFERYVRYTVPVVNPAALAMSRVVVAS